MKKTSLVLAISALLYGTSSVYVLADDVVLSDFITEDGELIDNTVSLPAGFNNPQPLPLNVAIDESYPAIERSTIRMCDPSFTVNGPAMTEFPVTVNSNNVGVWGVDNKGNTIVTGTNWKLTIPNGDTWSATWTLTVDPGTTVNSILLEPSERNPHNMWYAFDVGGKLPRFPADRPSHEHTPDAARGQFIVQRDPKLPPPIFTATYSGPVYTTVPLPISEGGTGSSHGAVPDSTSIPLGNSSIDRHPTHDLYSTLLINFPGGLTGDAEINPSFGFVADTDCLPVEGVEVNSYKDGILDFTVAGDGAVAIIEDGKQTGLRFEVSRDIDGGIKNFQIPFIPRPGSCYFMRDENTGNEIKDTHYCAPN